MDSSKVMYYKTSGVTRTMQRESVKYKLNYNFFLTVSVKFVTHILLLNHLKTRFNECIHTKKIVYIKTTGGLNPQSLLAMPPYKTL